MFNWQIMQGIMLVASVVWLFGCGKSPDLEKKVCSEKVKEALTERYAFDLCSELAGSALGRLCDKNKDKYKKASDKACGEAGILKESCRLDSKIVDKAISRFAADIGTRAGMSEAQLKEELKKIHALRTKDFPQHSPEDELLHPETFQQVCP